jgi:hypothetical protein
VKAQAVLVAQADAVSHGNSVTTALMQTPGPRWSKQQLLVALTDSTAGQLSGVATADPKTVH